VRTKSTHRLLASDKNHSDVKALCQPCQFCDKGQDSVTGNPNQTIYGGGYN
jgi:hypothetical protein